MAVRPPLPPRRGTGGERDEAGQKTFKTKMHYKNNMKNQTFKKHHVNPLIFQYFQYFQILPNLSDCLSPVAMVLKVSAGQQPPTPPPVEPSKTCRGIQKLEEGKDETAFNNITKKRKPSVCRMFPIFSHPFQFVRWFLKFHMMFEGFGPAAQMPLRASVQAST